MALRARVVPISLFWLICLPLLAQELPVKTHSPGDAQEQNIEEITVIGQRELYSLKMEVIRAEDLKFEIFNSLNSTDDFDITCERHASTGTRIQNRFCDVGYLKKARAEDARDFLNFGQGYRVRTEQQLAVEFAAKTKALNKEMIALAVEHPELATAMVRANELKQRYLTERREKYKNSIFIGHPKPEKNIVVLNELDMLHISFLDHKRGKMTDEIWDRWDKWYRFLFRKESYRTMWASANRETVN